MHCRNLAVIIKMNREDTACRFFASRTILGEDSEENIRKEPSLQ